MVISEQPGSSEAYWVVRVEVEAEADGQVVEAEASEGLEEAALVEVVQAVAGNPKRKAMFFMEY